MNFKEKMLKYIEEYPDVKDWPIFDQKEDEITISVPYPHTIETLFTADVLVSFEAGFELKRNGDIRTSFYSRHLYRQLIKMMKYLKWTGLIIEITDPINTFDEEFTPELLDKVCKSIVYHWSIPVFLSKSHEETIQYIYELWMTRIKGPKFVPPANFTPRTSVHDLWDDQIYLISSFLKVGYDKAVKLLDHFETPEKVIEWFLHAKSHYTKGKGNFVLDDKLPIKGIGKTSVQINRKLLTEKGVKPKIAQTHS